MDVYEDAYINCPQSPLFYIPFVPKPVFVNEGIIKIREQEVRSLN
jgi:hypothetical protein